MQDADLDGVGSGRRTDKRRAGQCRDGGYCCCALDELSSIELHVFTFPLEVCSRPSTAKKNHRADATRPMRFYAWSDRDFLVAVGLSRLNFSATGISRSRNSSPVKLASGGALCPCCGLNIAKSGPIPQPKSFGP